MNRPITRRRWAAAALGALAWRLDGALADAFPPEQVATVREGLRFIYSLEHARAEELFGHMIAAAPADPTGYAYLAATIWLRELTAQQELSIDRFAASDFFAELPRRLVQVDSAVEARFRQVSGQALERVRARLAKNPRDRAALFLAGLAYQNLASLEASLKRNWWAAFRYGSRTFGYSRELLALDPAFADARLATGVYNYVAGSLGWSVRWLALLMGYRGSRSRGKQDLETAVREAQLTGDDARVILALVYTREHDYRRAYQHLEALLRRYPRNYLVHLDMAGLELRMGQPARAVAIYEDVLRRRDAAEPSYRELERAAVCTRLGAALREQRDFAAAVEWLRRGLASPGVSERAAALAHLELGKTLEQAGRREEADSEYRLAAAAPDFAGSRQEARQRLDRR
jgi:Tfp pilus assembly protein PilF